MSQGRKTQRGRCKYPPPVCRQGQRWTLCVQRLLCWMCWPLPDNGTSSTDNISNDPTPSVEISLTGTGAVVGDVVKLLSGATQVGTATLSAQNIADGKVSITASDLGANGTKIADGHHH